MKVMVLGANGKVGRHLVRILIERDHQVRSLLREPSQRDFQETLGAEVVLGDLEGDLGPALEGIDACVFTAGSGGSTGKDKTLMVDLWGAVKSFRACSQAEVKRYLMISARNAGDPDRGREAIRPYLAAKHAADELLARSGLEYTILRPGRLTDDPGTGRITAARRLDDQEGSIPREDVARTAALALEIPESVGRVVELLSGNDPIADSIRAWG